MGAGHVVVPVALGPLLLLLALLCHFVGILRDSLNIRTARFNQAGGASMRSAAYRDTGQLLQRLNQPQNRVYQAEG